MTSVVASTDSSKTKAHEKDNRITQSCLDWSRYHPRFKPPCHLRIPERGSRFLHSAVVVFVVPVMDRVDRIDHRRPWNASSFQTRCLEESFVNSEVSA